MKFQAPMIFINVTVNALYFLRRLQLGAGYLSLLLQQFALFLSFVELIAQFMSLCVCSDWSNEIVLSDQQWIIAVRYCINKLGPRGGSYENPSATETNLWYCMIFFLNIILHIIPANRSFILPEIEKKKSNHK